MYERDFLLKFQPVRFLGTVVVIVVPDALPYLQYCREKPTGLPSIEVILGYDDKKGMSPKTKGGQASQLGWLRGSGAAPFAQRGGGRGTPAGRFT